MFLPYVGGGFTPFWDASSILGFEFDYFDPESESRLNAMRCVLLTPCPLVLLFLKHFPLKSSNSNPSPKPNPKPEPDLVSVCIKVGVRFQ